MDEHASSRVIYRELFVSLSIHVFLSLSRSTSPCHVPSLDCTQAFNPHVKGHGLPRRHSRVSLIIIKNFHVSAVLAYINILGDRVQLKESARLHLPILPA